MLGFTRNVLSLLLVGAVVGCQAQAGGVITVKPKTGDKGKVDAKKPAVVTRAVELFVNAPASLVAAGAGNIVGDDPSSLVVAGGLNLVAAGAGNIVAAGAGNIVAAGAGNLLVRTPAFRLQATALDTFKGVENAVVFFKTLTPEGELISKVAAKSDAKGNVKFMAVQDTNVMAVAKFKLDGKVYELTAPIAKGVQTQPSMVDPINTFVAGRIRAILKDNGITADAPLLLEELRKVWDIFNERNLTLGADDLKENASLADLDAFYKAKMALIPDDEAGKKDKETIMSYMAKISAADK